MNSNLTKPLAIKILRNRQKLQKKLKVTFTIDSENKINFVGKEEDIFLAEQVIEAIEMGFEINSALLLTESDYDLELVNIKDVTKKKDLETVRARIIGTKGKTLDTLSEISNCDVVLHDNVVGIIGPAERIKQVITAIESLIRGSKQTNVYKYLEKQRKNIPPSDIGLK